MRTTLAAIAGDGFAVLPGVLDRPAIDRCIDALEDVFAAERDIADIRRWHTSAYRVAYMLPAKQATFLDLCRPGPLVKLAAAVRGADSVLAGFNGIAMLPGGDGQPLHRDHPHPTPGTTLYLHAVVALDRFTVANGATRIVPGSHRLAKPPGEAADDPIGDAATGRAGEAPNERDGARHIELAPGAAVIFDASCLHAGSANATDAPRRALHLLFARRWVQPHWDFPGSIRADDAATLDDERRRLLGYGNTPARYDHEERRSFGYGWG